MMRIECVRRLRAMVAIATDNANEKKKRIQIESRPFSSRALQTQWIRYSPDYGHFANPQ